MAWKRKEINEIGNMKDYMKQKCENLQISP